MAENGDVATPTAAESKALKMAERLWRDAQRGLSVHIDGMSLWKIRERNERRYLGDHHDSSPASGIKQATINKIGTAITTTTSVQTEQPWRLKLTPVTTDEPPLFFLTDTGIRKLQRLSQPQRPGPNGEPAPPPPITLNDFSQDVDSQTPLPQDMGEALFELTKTQTVPITDPTTGEVVPQQVPPLLEEDKDIIAVTDAVAAGAMQTVAESLLDQALVDIVTTVAETQANITGDAAVTFEFDVEEQRIRLDCPNWTNYRYQPNSMWVSHARYAFLQQSMPLRDALVEFESNAEAIKALKLAARADESVPDDFFSTDDRKEGGKEDFTQQVMSASYALQSSKAESEPHVTIRTLWKRGHLFPVEEDDPQIAEGMASMQSGKRGATAELLEEGRQDTQDPPRSRRGIRQIKYIAEYGIVLEDIECPYSDIPMPYVKNILIPSLCYGQGEPFRMESLQDLINRVTGILLNMLRANAYPEMIMPKTVREQLGRVAEDFHSRPNRITTLEDEDYKDYVQAMGRAGWNVEAPRIEAVTVNMLQMLLREAGTHSGEVEVLQGQPASSEQSGVAFDSAVGAASRVMSFKARSLEWTFEYIARLTIDSIVKWLTRDEWMRYIRKYNGAVLEAIQGRAVRQRYDIKVEAIAGRAGNDRLDAERAERMFRNQALSTQSYLEMNRHADPKGEMARLTEEQRKAMREQLNAQAGQVPPRNSTEQSGAAPLREPSLTVPSSANPNGSRT